MNANFQDLDNENNPMNGVTYSNWADIHPIFEKPIHRPYMIQLQLENKCKLDIGLAQGIGCVQRSPPDGMPPYRMATTINSPPFGQGETEFSVGGTATPIDNHYCLPLPLVVQIVRKILHGEEPSNEIAWEDV